MKIDTIIQGDNVEQLSQLPSESIDLVVTSPPYDGLRVYLEQKSLLGVKHD